MDGQVLLLLLSIYYFILLLFNYLYNINIALHWAVFANSPIIVRYLLDECVANRNIKCYHNKKPYHLAIFKKYGECEGLLLDKKMKMSLASGDHYTDL